MFSLLLSALIVSADTPTAAPAATPVVEPAKKQREKKICRKPQASTGSNMVRRICLTENEWAKRDEGASAEDLKTMGSN
jgi:hypothetical protein